MYNLLIQSDQYKLIVCNAWYLILLPTIRLNGNKFQCVVAFIKAVWVYTNQSNLLAAGVLGDSLGAF